ncbi:MarR family transcriptional regulator [Methanothermobacter thermautotrophicus]|uniref:MarR family transcriptional regulator n=1 Tax=Methanothermobacter thermautotrophicus TaxID=145262 RepID=A0A842YPZ1_METTF|nr:MarR family transcriptional regulator [Methanothermobacter thermautotrophicus]MBE2900431.1 MarR family transcriptional regulator [Methanothermobacter thermautotrophicus]
MQEIRDAHGETRESMERYILVAHFLIEQRWSYIVSREFLEDDITAKQWLFLVILGNVFERPPSMQEMADAMSTTHQNVKQLAVRLEDKGLIKINQDPENRRIMRLEPTERFHEFWAGRDERDTHTVKSLFNSLDDEEVKSLFNIFSKLEEASKQRYMEYRKR